MTQDAASQKPAYVVWKRPDGFHGATPADFHVVEIGGVSRIWLHHFDKDNFPFRIAGGWQETEATHRLNNLVNLLNRPTVEWIGFLQRTFDNSRFDEPVAFVEDLSDWLHGLEKMLKGDTWETEIMSNALIEVGKQILRVKAEFLKKVA